MKFAQFIKMALNITIEYYNRYELKNNIKIGEEDVYIEYTIDNREVFVCILYVISNPDLKYVVSYDKKSKTINSYLATNIQHLIDENNSDEVYA